MLKISCSLMTPGSVGWSWKESSLRLGISVK